MITRSSSDRRFPARALALGTTLILVAGCSAGRQGRLYDASKSAVGSLHFSDFDDWRGTMDASLPDATRCSGRYVTVPVSVLVRDDSSDHMFAQREDDSHAGLAVLTCSDGRVLRCRFFKRVTPPDWEANGDCKDAAGGRYSFLF